MREHQKNKELQEAADCGISLLRQNATWQEQMGNPSVIILDHWLKEKAVTTWRAVYKVYIQPFPLIDSKRFYMQEIIKKKGRFNVMVKGIILPFSFTS